jgi:hypothetical protein
MKNPIPTPAFLLLLKQAGIWQLPQMTVTRGSNAWLEWPTPLYCGQGDVDLAAMLTAKAVQCVDEAADAKRRRLN